MFDLVLKFAMHCALSFSCRDMRNRPLSYLKEAMML